jgi:hypothetical protein
MADAADIPDRELTRVLREHGPLLEEQIRALLATGAAEIAVPRLLLHARMRSPRRWRKGLLEVTSEDPFTGATLASTSPLRRTPWPPSLTQEIAIRLALEIVNRLAQPG